MLCGVRCKMGAGGFEPLGHPSIAIKNADFWQTKVRLNVKDQKPGTPIGNCVHRA